MACLSPHQSEQGLGVCQPGGWDTMVLQEHGPWWESSGWPDPRGSCRSRLGAHLPGPPLVQPRQQWPFSQLTWDRKQTDPVPPGL